MTISTRKAEQTTLVPPPKGPAIPAGAPKTPAKFGNTPAASVSVSAQASAKALAIKNGHDPDGIQDGK